MAVGGIPNYQSNLTDTEEHENLQAQNEEIQVLQSIFEGEDDRLEILNQATPGDGPLTTLAMLKLNIPVPCPNQIHVDVYQPIAENGPANSSGVQLARSESGQRVIWGFDVDYLPPVCLHVTLPQSYPSQEPPSYAVSCLWMSPPQLTLVCRELDRIWDASTHEGTASGMPVLYTWIDWLTESVLGKLGVQDSLSVSVHSVDENVDDCRVVIETTDLNNIVTSMMRYNMSQRVRAFYKSEQQCEICYHSGSGAHFYLLPDCGHHMCRNCLSSHCQMIVTEGNVQNLMCPMYQCRADIHPATLKELLSNEDFERYETLALQKALDVMEDVTYCPRCNCVVISEPEKHLMLGFCPQCNFAFCTDCREKWHQGEKCALMVEKVKEVLSPYEKEHRKRELEKKKENRYSYLYLQKMAKKCPKCRAPMMKINGCNHVKCGACGQHLCWSCGQAIRGYEHFVDNQSCSTFSTYDIMIDNADMPINNPYIYRAPAIQVPAIQVVTPWEREMADSEGRRIKDRLKENPELKEERCVACKQTNIKENRNNLIRCWSCKASFCCYCKTKIIGPVGRHFSGVKSCPQHSD